MNIFSIDKKMLILLFAFSLPALFCEEPKTISEEIDFRVVGIVSKIAEGIRSTENKEEKRVFKISKIEDAFASNQPGVTCYKILVSVDNGRHVAEMSLSLNTNKVISVQYTELTDSKPSGKEVDGP